ncbi:DNA polymerase IV [Spelaeicoccus albus]|uniref:DNA polymerase IV n=1 Tax=Spelaeicoccus albus TaxID=1280376 RepID=A0A7Z0IJ06_9MICO|nr:DNA polymerase IV [Spelaeicoccus albus]NYI69004.1 DNA polymerase-4 [Spelaeicoccus albus]
MSRKQLFRPAAGLADLQNALGRDDAGSTILHVDMDAFFASVELLERPELVGKPAIVGGSSHRGVVVSATYEAREYGVHSAMPMARARALCPGAVIIPPSRGSYSRYSHIVMNLMREITDHVQPLSIDEAFIDVASAVRRLGSPATIAQALRARVAAETSLTCSIGVAPNQVTAKLASTRSKPDGMLVVPASSIHDFLRPLPVGSLPGVGSKTKAALERYGIGTVGELADLSESTIVRALGENGRSLRRLARGVDPRRVTPRGKEKSVGAEVTFETDLVGADELRRELLTLAEKTAARLRAGGVAARTAVLKLRYSDFHTVTRSKTLEQPTDVSDELYRSLSGILIELASSPGHGHVRLIGVRGENLESEPTLHRQPALGEREFTRRDAEVASDRARARFGQSAVRPASLLRRDDK